MQSSIAIFPLSGEIIASREMGLNGRTTHRKRTAGRPNGRPENTSLLPSIVVGVGTKYVLFESRDCSAQLAENNGRPDDKRNKNKTTETKANETIKRKFILNFFCFNPAHSE